MTESSPRERVLRTVAGKAVDRVPISAPVGWSPLQRQGDANHWYNRPEYCRLASLVQRYSDPLVHITIHEHRRPTVLGDSGGQRPDAAHRAGIFDRRFYMSPPELLDIRQSSEASGRRLLSYTLHTPKGDLTCAEAMLPGSDCTWDVEHLVKEPDDAAKLLSVPYRFDTPDLSAYFDTCQQLGDQGVVAVFVTSPMVMVSQLTGVERFMEWTLTERPLIERLIATAYERVSDRLEYILQHGVGPLIHFGGSEQATPPFMPGKWFDDFVVAYEGRLWKMTHDAGRLVWVHCHGRIATILDRFLEAGVDLLDPVEPPPQGDIEIGDAKRLAGAANMTLIGNIEWSDLQACSPDEIETKVRHAVCDGGRQRFILGTSAGPLSSAELRQSYDNLVRYMEAGVKYGTF